MRRIIDHWRIIDIFSQTLVKGNIDLNDKPTPTSGFSMAVDVKCHSATPKLIGPELPYLTYYIFTNHIKQPCVSPTWTRVTRSTRAANQDRSSQATLPTLVMTAINFKVMFLNVQYQNEKS